MDESTDKVLAGEEMAYQYLTFEVGQERLAVSISDVKELIEVDTITPVPMMPEFILGVSNLRGTVIPILDLAARLGRAPCQLTKNSSIVLVEHPMAEGIQLIGMLVDEVNEILEIGADHIQPTPSFGVDIRHDFIQAMGRVGEEFIILLDIHHVLCSEEISALEQFGQQVGNYPEQESLKGKRDEISTHITRVLCRQDLGSGI
ncbi:chemotaxis protein CheW [Dongshaea marina]|uniref:chemotaxis protein CheW n=1 Tax=Dongshaea marina TaxID=2047966 RepID=UPI000D3EB2BC|nr:chemotaxis protein CheW [Dongshaea marina]